MDLDQPSAPLPPPAAPTPSTPLTPRPVQRLTQPAALTHPTLPTHGSPSTHTAGRTPTAGITAVPLLPPTPADSSPLHLPVVQLTPDATTTPTPVHTVSATNTFLTKALAGTTHQATQPPPPPYTPRVPQVASAHQPPFDPPPPPPSGQEWDQPPPAYTEIPGQTGGSGDFDPGALTEFQVDALTHRMIDRIIRQVRAELRRDRERIGKLRDTRH